MVRWLWLLVLYGIALLISPAFGTLDSPQAMLLWALGGAALMLGTAWMLYRLTHTDPAIRS